MVYKTPNEILKIIDILELAGFEAYLVGGCVRDLLLGAACGEPVEPKDWDITTNARPEEIQKVFPDSFYENDFGTVGVKTGSDEKSLAVVEVTPYRIEEKYSDKRHPDEVKFSQKLEDDLKRRDFTVNAMALRLGSGQAYEITDLFGGQEDLKKKIIKTVGKPEERFEEDALRILRAVRLAAELGFSIEKETEKILSQEAGSLKVISEERIRDEFIKIIMSDNAVWGLKEMQKLGILKYIVPELEEGIGVTQNKEHIFTVWDHNLKALGHAVEKNFSFEVRMAALLHDVGKPRTKRGEGTDSTFYNHEMVGAKMTSQILSRLCFPKKIIEKIVKLVRWHLFFSDTEVITLSAVRRIVRNVGPENVWDLMSVRFCDRIGMGRPKEQPYRLRKYESMIEEAMRAPVHVSQLKIEGRKVMETAGLEPSPKVGFILHALLEEVLDDPSLNTEKYLLKRVGELAKFSDEKLKELGVEAKERKEKEEEKEISKIRSKYGVK
ncbi:CCA tRNA nucleotidyltransferase [Patescibacteria group bacterium]|nr:CCA tRNA nucleotidyltransferase [Patescibacteria group bacterium]